MSASQVEVFAKIFEMEFEATRKAAESVPPKARLKQAKEGKAHPLWLIGHLAFATDNILNVITFGGKHAAPRSFNKLFAPDILGGAPIVADTGAYPSWEDTFDTYKRVCDQCVQEVSALTDDQLPGPVKGTPPDQFRDFFRSVEHALRISASHEAYHRGQMNLIANL